MNARIERRSGATPWLLFDNERDPYQTRNLANDTGHAGTLAELDAMVNRWRERLGEA